MVSVPSVVKCLFLLDALRVRFVAAVHLVHVLDRDVEYSTPVSLCQERKGPLLATLAAAPYGAPTPLPQLYLSRESLLSSEM